jgi:ABC-type glycerol-3-phosphate transport system substrate-binding protein
VEGHCAVFTRINRRRAVGLSLGASASLLGSRWSLAQDPTPTPEPTPEPINIGEGDIEISMWVQNFGPVITSFQAAAQTYADKTGGVKVTVQPIPYADLQAKMLPAVAAGDEADILMGYTNWYLATDVSRLWLELDDYFGGRAAIEELVYPGALGLIETPEDKTFYLPYLSGLDGVTLTLNQQHYLDARIDYTTFTTWEEYVEAGKALTQASGDEVTRAGLSCHSTAYYMLGSFIYQTGGNFFDKESGTWSYATAEGEAALQRIYDLLWTDRTASLTLAASDADGFLEGTISTISSGAYLAGSAAGVSPDRKTDVVALPPVAGAVEDVVSPYNLSVITLSRRLADDETKLQHCVGIVNEMLSADAMIDITNSYSGILCSPRLYADPRVEQTTYGAMSKRVAEATFSRARYPQGRVANTGPAQIELDRALNQEISIQEALKNVDTYLNEQEQQARERLG